jgi:hypothetical protein
VYHSEAYCQYASASLPLDALPLDDACWYTKYCRRFSTTTSAPERPLHESPSGSGAQYRPPLTHWLPHGFDGAVQPQTAPS